MKTVRFAAIIGSDGEVIITSHREAQIARRVAGTIELEPGGMIVMSTDVNAEVGRGFVNWAKGFMKTWWNRLMKSQKVDDTLKDLVKERGVDTGWSIGNLFSGRYLSPKTGQTFNEKSFSVDILGVPFEFVRKVADALRKKFDQEAVLVIDHDTNKTYLET